MNEKRPLGITLIGYFYVFGAIILIITLFTNDTNQFGLAVRVGLPKIPENIIRILLAIISLIMSYGYLKLKKWGYWFMIIYTLYFLVVSIFLSLQYKQQPFYGNVIWSIIVFVYTLMKRKYFNKNYVSSFGIIGTPDEETIKFLEEKAGKSIRKIEKNGKTKIIIGKGLFRKIIKID